MDKAKGPIEGGLSRGPRDLYLPTKIPDIKVVIASKLSVKVRYIFGTPGISISKDIFNKNFFHWNSWNVPKAGLKIKKLICYMMENDSGFTIHLENLFT